MHLWIVNHHAALPSKDGRGGRHLSLSERLPVYGWTSSLIVASTKHPEGKQQLRNMRLRRLTAENGVPTLWVRTNAYGSNLPLRFLGMIVFASNLLRPGITRGLQRPDAIMGSTVHPFAAWAGYRLATRFRVPFIYEIRDVWPESLHELSSITAQHPLSRIIKKVDSILIKKAALVISPLPFVDKHLSEMGFEGKPFSWISNGDVLPESWREPTVREGDPFTFMYLGAHGRANALDDILHAFDLACRRADGQNLRLRFVGDGPLKSALADEASKLECAGFITFEDRIPKTEVLARAQEADCLIINVPNKKLYRFGVSANKYFTYLSAGRPIIAASSAPNNPVREAGAGIEVPGGDIRSIAEAMIHMSTMSETERAELARNGLAELKKHYTYDVLAQKLAVSLNGIVAPDSMN